MTIPLIVEATNNHIQRWKIEKTMTHENDTDFLILETQTRKPTWNGFIGLYPFSWIVTIEGLPSPFEIWCIALFCFCR
jgi:hypothetical protein